MSRLNSQNYNWFALRVLSQRELVAKQILTDAGFATFVPTKIKPEFANGVARVRMKKDLIKRVLIPGYCFLGKNEHTPGWAGVFRFRIITGILWHGGKPYEIPHETRKGHKGRDGAPDIPDRPGLRDLMWRYNAGEFNAPDHHLWMDTNEEFEEGADVISDAGVEGEVGKITGNMAKFLFGMMGQKHEIDIALVRLRLR